MHKAMQGFDEFASQVIKEWKVPGAALAIVKDGEVVYCQGYGLRNVEDNLPVTPETLFAIGSTTKAFAAVSIGILVDDGVLEWDRPIREYIPEFKMVDPFASERLTVRDMLCHRSGLPGHDLVWYHRQMTRKEFMQSLAYLEPNQDFRSRWQYQNIIFASIGYLLEALTGKPWEALVKERILLPLGMTATNFSVNASQKTSDFCYPYLEKEEVVKRIPFANIDPVGPAGNINSNLEDMARWLVLNLSKGKFGETQVVSEANLKTLHRPQMVVLEENPFDAAGTDSHLDYGLAWDIYHYRGIPVVGHSGAIDGFATEVALVPGENLGVVTFTNLSSAVPMILYRSALDRMLGLEPIDWHGKFKVQFARMRETQKEARQKSSSERKLNTQPSHALQDYAGQYQHPAYGQIEFKEEDGKLSAIWRDWSIPLDHYHYDVFAGELPIMQVPLKFTFEMDDKGNIERFSSPMEASVKPIVFSRLASEEMSKHSFLEPFTGEYELMGQVLKIFFKGEHTLVASGPGMAEIELVPYRGTQFTLKGAGQVSLEFKMNGAAAASEVVVMQPGATLTAKRKA